MKKEKPSTKICKHCKTEIPYGAKICPQCRKKQGMSIWLIAIIVIVVIGAIEAIASGGKGEQTTTAAVTSSSGSQSQEASTAAPESTAADNRDAAADANRQITNLVQAAEADYNVLVDMISSGKASDLDLYDTAKKVDSNLGSYQVKISKIKCKGIKDYSDAASSYIINMQLTASYVKKYVDKQKMADLSSAKDCIAHMNNYIYNLVAKQMEFLKASGFTDDEVANILSEAKESTASK